MSTLVPLVAVNEKSDEESNRTIVHRIPHGKREAVAPIVNHWSLSKKKRLFDVLVSLLVLGFLGLPLLVLIICIRLTSRGPAVFVQKRIGQDGFPFSIYKLRTMRPDAASCGIGLTQSGDRRITPIGRWLRKLKLDELPQFYNVLRGDMSVVGPRPKLPEYADNLNVPYRPGITGAASLAFRCEEDLLVSIPPDEVEQFYQEHIKPVKANLDLRYMLHATFSSDLRIILSTLLSSFCPASPSKPESACFSNRFRQTSDDRESAVYAGLLQAKPREEAIGID